MQAFKKLFFSALFLSIAQLSFAQQGSLLSGTILDGGSREPLAFANVGIVDLGIGTSTDLDGRFKLANIRAGTFEVTFSYLGYETQTRQITFTKGEEFTIELSLQPEGMLLGEIVVNGQAMGQRAAINQQVNANTIVNVISKEKLRELPDQNAAESVGRIAGVALQREGGEATKVSIRGLSPRYNSITINGERIPATDGNDRSVDLSMISTDALEGIEVFKAITPDRDGDAIGGTVNFVIKDADEGLRSEIKVLGGYNDQQENFGLFRGNASISNRFLNNKLGIIVGGNYQLADRSSDLLTASYVITGEDADGNAIINTENLNLADRVETRTRGGANLSLDYRLPFGKLQLSSFYGLVNRDEVRYRTRYRPEGSRKEYELRQRNTDQSTWNSTFLGQFDLNFLDSRLEVRASYATTALSTPNERTHRFREDGAFTGEIEESDLELVVAAAKNDLEATFFQQDRIDDTEVNTDKVTAQLDYSIPFKLEDQLSGSFKFGGKIRIQERDRVTQRLWSAFGALDEVAAANPDRFELNNDDRITVSQFFGTFSPDPYLDNRYTFGFGQTLDIDRLNAFTDTYKDEFYSLDERQRLQNYSSSEDVLAGYAMATFRLFNKLTLVGGVRAEQTNTSFEGLFGRSFEADGQVFISAQDTVGSSNYLEWLPMVQMRYELLPWMNVRAAATKTLARPNFFDLIPWQQIDDINGVVQRGNPELAHTVAWNYDAQLSFYNKYGLLTIGGFYKRLRNVDFQRISRDVDENSATRGYQLITRENLETDVTVLGIEVDLQAQLSFLPHPFDGIIIGGNVTLMESETQFPILEVIPGEPPFFIPTLVNSFRDGILPDQPAEVYNLNVGYEIGGFSARLSMISQGKTLQFVGSRSELDGFFEGFTRWDFAMNQRINKQIKVYFNLNNITNTPEVVTLGQNNAFPLEEEFFGWTMDLGVRFRFTE
ncbi:MAG: TonB-dependent receptor [Bacteroidota bacterium]